MSDYLHSLLSTLNRLSPILFLIGCIIATGWLVIKTSGQGGTIRSGRKIKRRATGIDGLIYDATPLMTEWEINFFDKIKSALSRDLECFTQVRYADFIQVSEDYDRLTRYNANKKIFGKSADFVIYSVKKKAVVLVYELNDSTHNRPDRMERDALISSILASANIPLIQVKPFEERNIRKDLGMR